MALFVEANGLEALLNAALLHKDDEALQSSLIAAMSRLLRYHGSYKRLTGHPSSLELVSSALARFRRNEYLHAAGVSIMEKILGAGYKDGVAELYILRITESDFATILTRSLSTFWPSRGVCTAALQCALILADFGGSLLA